jgi:hypothetical protein
VVILVRRLKYHDRDQSRVWCELLPPAPRDCVFFQEAMLFLVFSFQMTEHGNKRIIFDTENADELIAKAEK